MKKILIVTSQKEKFSPFIDALTREAGVETILSESADAAIESVSADKPSLVVIDETVGETPGLKIARNILMKNAMVNQAVVSSLTPEEFHEASEGLGIMAQLPPTPDAASAKMLLDTLKMMP